MFERLDWFRGARNLIEHAVELKKNGKIQRLEVLSASGGQPYHDEVVHQKNKWLKSRGIFKMFDAVNIVESGKKKGEFAHPRAILVDDTYHVVDNFRKQGGVGLLHDGRVDDMFYQIDLSLKTFN
jgi:MoaA/NifB/PqqE/SkfB family radical SAM enzyme